MESKYTTKIVAVFPIILVAFCLLSLKYFTFPWVWIFLSLIVFLLILGFSLKNKYIKIVAFNLLALPATLLVAEIYFHIDSLNVKTTLTDNLPGYYTRRDEISGYAPVPNIKPTLTKLHGEDIVYNVTYTINDDGLRWTPSSNESSEKCILFWGGSYTFGEGLNDNETLSFYIGRGLNNNYKIYNWGFHGYGPHQMLSNIENRLIDLAKGCVQLNSIYSIDPDHINRAVGNTLWDDCGPKYILEEGKLVKKGHFDSQFKDYIYRKAIKKLRTSLTFDKLIRKFYRQQPNQIQIDTFCAIIQKSKEELQKTNDGSRFIAVLWDTNNLSGEIDKKNIKNIINCLSESDIEYYLVGDILEGYRENRQHYSLSPFDSHPNAKANKQLAEYLIGRLTNKM